MAAQNIGNFEVDVLPNFRKFQAEAKAFAKTVDIEIPVEFIVKPQSVAALKRDATAMVKAAGGVDIQADLDLDEKSVAGAIAEAKTLAKAANINFSTGFNVKSLERFKTSLRGLRDDLSALDAFATRVFRTMALGFTGLVGGATVAFGALAAIGILRFGQIEEAANKASAVFASGTVQQKAAIDGVKTSMQEFLALNEQYRARIIQTSREVGIATSFSADQVATGIESLAQAGIGIQDSLEGIDTVAKFAQASGEDLATTSELLVQGFIGAGNSADEFGEKVGSLADMLTFAATDSAQSLKDILQGFQNDAAAAFTAYGQSAAETINTLNLLGAAGIKGLKGGTSAAIVIRDIFKSVNASPAAFKKYGIAVTEADGTTRSFAAILDDLTKVFNEQTAGFTKPKRFDALRKEFGFALKSFRQLQSLLVTVNKLQQKGSGATAKLNELLAESGGILQLRSEAVVQTFVQRFQQVRESISALLSVFAAPAAQALKEFFADLVEGGGKSSGVFKQLQAQARELGATFRDNLVVFLDQLRGPEGAAFFSGLRDGLIDILSGVKGFFTELAAAFSEGDVRSKSFLEVLGELARGFGAFAKDILPQFGEALGKAFKFIADHPDLFKALAKNFVALLVVSKALRIIILPLASLVTRLAGAFEKLTALTGGEGVGGLIRFRNVLGSIAKVLKIVGGPELAIFLALFPGALKGARKELAKQIGPIKESFNELKGLFSSFGDSDSGGAIIEAFKLIGRALDVAGQAIGKWFSAQVIGNMRLFLDTFKLIVAVFKGDLPAVKDSLKDMGKDILASFTIDPETIKSGWNSVVDFFKGLGPAISSMWEGIKSSFSAGIQSIVASFQGLVDGIQQKWHELRSKSLGDIAHMMGEVSGRILGAVAELLVKLALVIPTLAVKLFHGLQSAWNSVQAFFAGIPDRVGSFFDSAADKVRAAVGKIVDFIKSIPGRVSSAWQSFKDGVRDAVDRVVEFFVKLPGRVKHFVLSIGPAILEAAHDLYEKAKELGGNIVDGIVDGVKNVPHKAKEAVKSFADGFMDGFMDEFDIGSPSKRAAREIGVPITEGVALGIKQGTPQAIAAAKEMAATFFAQLTGSDQGQAIAAGKQLGAKTWDAAATGIKTEAAKTGSNLVRDALLPPGLGDIIYPAAKEVGKKTWESAKSGVEVAAFETGKHGSTIQEALLPPGLGAIINPKAHKVGEDAGKGITEGVKRGIEINLPKVHAGVQSVIDLVTNRLEAAGRALERTSLATRLASIQTDVSHLEKTLVGIRRAAGRVILALRVGIGKQAAALARKLADMVLSLGTVAIRNVRVIQPQLTQAGMLIADTIAKGIALGTLLASAQIRQSGLVMLAFFTSGMKIGAALYAYPTAIGISNRSATLLRVGVPIAVVSGIRVMTGFYNGLNFIYTTKVQPLILSIAQWIRDNKGPISYDQTLLRPAGEAIMSGFKTGLQDGFGEIKGWVREVGPYVADLVDDKLFFERSANFLIGNAKTDLAFDPHSMFDDLLPDIPLGLHPTSGLADTTAMAKKIADYYGMVITSIFRPGAITSSGNVSQHALGQAADFAGDGGLSGWMYVASQLSLLIDKVFKQIITNNSLWRGGSQGFGFVPDHMDHLHLGWVPKRRQGGNMTGGNVYQVNEDGRELFIPSHNGQMFTANDMRELLAWIHRTPDANAKMFAAGGPQKIINQVIHSNATDPHAVAAVIAMHEKAEVSQIQRN